MISTKNKTNSMTCTYSIVIMLIGITLSLDIADTVHPKFDPSTHMRLVLVPADAQIGSIIYRLRAIDEEFDYPLTFELIGDTASTTVMIETLPCTKYNSVCQANVVLQRPLEIGRYYDFEISVKDTEGGLVTKLCSITATNFTTPSDLIFPHKPDIIVIPEGSQLFAIRQKILSEESTEGTIFLLGPLDYENQAMHHLKVLANDAYAEPGQDSRNIAGLDVVVIVQDVQDQPPVFTSASPVTKLSVDILPGDTILKVHAVDGDKGNPREIRYGLVSEGNPFTSFFNINDISGEITLMRPLEDVAVITNVGGPVLLTIVAEEVKVGHDDPPAMASTVQLALFLPERVNNPPYFENDHYISRVDENVPPGTALTFGDPYVPRVYDDGIDKNGAFSLTLINNNGTFEIVPNIVERSAIFLLRVRDNVLLDYEKRHLVQLQILAQEIGPVTNLSAIVNVTVFINDVNDNPPTFKQTLYMVELPENMTIGIEVVKVTAEDVDTFSSSGLVRYTAILGYLNTSLNLDSESGLITLATNNHGFDREVMPEYHLYVEARDFGGNGNRAQVSLIIQLLDVNDESPIFEKNLYEFILDSDLTKFTSMAFIYASDKDASEPNNQVRYEIINGNYDNKFNLEKVTGELTVREKMTLRKRRQSKPTFGAHMFFLTARAYDLGIPILSSTTNIRIYPPEIRTRTVTFVVPGENLDKLNTEEILATITGGKVLIHDIKLLPSGTDNISERNASKLKSSVVTATVLYNSSSVVDISQIQQRLLKSNGSHAIMSVVDAAGTDTLYKAGNKLLFWILILLASLVAIIILILLLCCICSWCPLYGATSKKLAIVNRTEFGEKLVHEEMANKKQPKSVQVSEWNRRREAWSAENSTDARTKSTRWEFYNGCKKSVANAEVHSAVNNEKGRTLVNQHSDKIKRFNTDITFPKSKTTILNDRGVCVEDIVDEQKFVYAHQNNNKPNLQLNQTHNDCQIKDIGDRLRHDIEPGNNDTSCSSLRRKQEVFIKDGNIEILKLMTRDKTRENSSAFGDENSIYDNTPIKSSNLSNPQLLMIDNSGKEILMRRFIEEQPNGKQIICEHYQVIPGVTGIQSMPNEIRQKSVLKEGNFSLSKSGCNSFVYSNGEPGLKVIHDQEAEEPMGLQTKYDIEPCISNQSLTHELETSIKQQNELLRQILMEKGKLESGYTQHEVILETQSLPGLSVATGTQTECDVGTQTELNYRFLKKTSKQALEKVGQRKARSENDDHISDKEFEYALVSSSSSPKEVYFIKPTKIQGNKQPKKRDIKSKNSKRIIRTPIVEEHLEALKCRRPTPSEKPLRRHAKTRRTVLLLSNFRTISSDKMKYKPRIYSTDTDNHNIEIGQYVNPDAAESDEKLVSLSEGEKWYEIPPRGSQANMKIEKKKLSRNSSECENQLQAELKLLHKVNFQPNKLYRHATQMQKSLSLNVINRGHSGKAEKFRGHQSERDVICQNDQRNDEEIVDIKVPKDMEMCKKKHENIQHSTNSLTKLTKIRKKQNTTEQPPVKTRAFPKRSKDLSEDAKCMQQHTNKKPVLLSNRLLKENTEINKEYKPKFTTEMNHPLLQHSEYRFERGNLSEVHLPPSTRSLSIYKNTQPVSTTKGMQDSSSKKSHRSLPINENKVNIGSPKNSLGAENTNTNSTKLYHLNVSALEDDHDSGIAMNPLHPKRVHRNPIADKKSIFSIAYDDVNGVKTIASGGESPENL
ncbi:cadherin-86C isoform X2 [Eurosta solidaginis]|uniref:cadherin-86C isoform X2 n=1 Tax=Eurosta solidaginis TaxID=178769 RepID=UPI0035310AD9